MYTRLKEANDLSWMNDIIENYPYPIASACNLWMNIAEPAAQFQQGLKAAEAVASFLGVIALSELRLVIEQNLYSPTQKIKNILLENSKGSPLNQVSFGTWLGWFREIYSELKGHSLFLSQLSHATKLIECLDKLNNLGNRNRHGSLVIDSIEKYRQGVKIIQEYMKIILKELSFLSDITFTYIEKILLEKKFFGQPVYIHQARNLKGHLIGKPIEVDEQFGRDSDSVILVQNKGQSYLSLFPFLIYSAAETEDLYYYDGGYKTGKYKYLGYKHGRIFKVQSEPPEEEWDTDELERELKRFFSPPSKDENIKSRPDIILAFEHFLTLLGVSAR